MLLKVGMMPRGGAWKHYLACAYLKMYLTRCSLDINSTITVNTCSQQPQHKWLPFQKKSFLNAQHVFTMHTRDVIQYFDSLVPQTNENVATVLRLLGVDVSVATYNMI